jgi:hypothetical protein
MDREGSWAVRTPTATTGKRLAIALGWALLLGYLFANAFSRIPRSDTGDFGHFYYAAKAMDEGQDIYASWHQGYVYPPLLAFLYEPFALLSENAAATILLFVNMLLMSVSAMLGARELARRFGTADWATAGLALAAILLTEDKLRGALQMWQTDLIMLFLLVLALCLLDRWPALAGTALGLAFNIKYLPVVALPYLLLRRRFVAAAAFLASAVGFALLPAIRTGWQVNRDYLAVAYRGLFHLVGVGTAAPAAHVWNIDNGLSVSITSAFSRILPAWAALIAAGGVALVTLFCASRLYRRHNVAFWYRPDGVANNGNDPARRAIVGLEWVGLSVGTLVFSPQTNTRHLCLLLLANTAAVVLLYQGRNGTRVPRWPLAFGTVLLVLAVSFPPGGQQHPSLLGPWHHMGGPTWVALGMYATLLWFGLRHAQVQWAAPATEPSCNAAEPQRPVLSAPVMV